MVRVSSQQGLGHETREFAFADLLDESSQQGLGRETKEFAFVDLLDSVVPACFENERKSATSSRFELDLCGVEVPSCFENNHKSATSSRFERDLRGVEGETLRNSNAAARAASRLDSAGSSSTPMSQEAGLPDTGKITGLDQETFLSRVLFTFWED
jgi:hypothetical protein